jgi:hypothetical protein
LPQNFPFFDPEQSISITTSIIDSNKTFLTIHLFHWRIPSFQKLAWLVPKHVLTFEWKLLLRYKICYIHSKEIGVLQYSEEKKNTQNYNVLAHNVTKTYPKKDNISNSFHILFGCLNSQWKLHNITVNSCDFDKNYTLEFQQNYSFIKFFQNSPFIQKCTK